MPRQQEFINPQQFVDLSQDYYRMIGLKPGDLPEPITKHSKVEITRILSGCFRKMAPRLHPDRIPGGDERPFKLLIKAIRILEDPVLRRYYESGGEDKMRFVEDEDSVGRFDINWERLGAYRQGTMPDTIGYALFSDVCDRKAELGLVPAFHPTDPGHAYEWDWVIEDQAPTKFIIALVQDENDVLRLTSGDMPEDSLPFKIHILIPRGALHFAREEQEKIVDEDGFVGYLPGRLRVATYSDYNLLETTSLDEAKKFLAPGGGLETSLARFRDGSLIQEQYERDKSASQNKWVGTEQMKNLDTDMLRVLLQASSFIVKKDERAADFLDLLPEEEAKSATGGARI